MKDIINQAMNLANQGQVNKARKMLREHWETNKTNVNVLITLAKLDLAESKFEHALQKAKAIIRRKPDKPQGYQIACNACFELNLLDEGRYYFLHKPAHETLNPLKKRNSNPILNDGVHIPSPCGAGNDYRFILNQVQVYKNTNVTFTKRVSIIIPVYDRHAILANTLAALTHQTYPAELMEVIVVDDGSNDAIFDVIKKYEHKLNLYYARQKDDGFHVAAARNLGLKLATGEAFIFFDADILPCPDDVKKYMEVLQVSDECLLIGHRRYVSVADINDDMILQDINVAVTLPSIIPDNDVSGKLTSEGESIDWRFPVYKKNNHLINDLWPFTKAAGGNIAFSRTLLEKAGLVDEDFRAWGCEDSEHAYRFYNAGAYFIPMLDIVSLHQEPLNQKKLESHEESFRAAGHKITKEVFAEKCSAPAIRNYQHKQTFEIPKVSIYIPTYNAEKYIVDAVNSCLNQTFQDLEVCICNDGSTDNTLSLLEQHFANNPKVRWVTQKNAGIGKATNTAITMARGMYIAQLDADDLLKEDAVKSCVDVLDRKNVDAVYTDCEYIDAQGKFIRYGYCGGDFSREWMATGMIATHFRMFRKRLWSRVELCNEEIKNAVDLDLWLKLYERSNVLHLHKSLYCYRWHGENTSIQHRKLQSDNRILVVKNSLDRLGLSDYYIIEDDKKVINANPFNVNLKSAAGKHDVSAKNIICLIPNCEKYDFKRQAVQNTWANDLKHYGIKYLFLVGDPKLVSAKLEQNTLFVPCEDNYESLLLKLTLGYEFIYQTLDFDYVYKIDDDCYPNVKHLVENLIPQLAGNQYMGGAVHEKNKSINNQWHFGKCSNNAFDKPYKSNIASVSFAKGGYGYFLRKDVLPVLTANIANFQSELEQFLYAPEDVRIAEVLAQSNVFVKKLQNYKVTKSDTFKVDVVQDEPYLYFDITSADGFEKIQRKWDARFANEVMLKINNSIKNKKVPLSTSHLLCNGVIYQSVPKSGCSTIRNVLLKHLELEVQGSIHNVAAYPTVKSAKDMVDFPRYTVIRDPLKRIVSCYREKIRDAQYNTNYFVNGVHKSFVDYGFTADMTLSDFVKVIAVIPDDLAENHFRSMTSILTHYGQIALPEHIYSLDDIEAFFLALDEVMPGVSHTFKTLPSVNIASEQPYTKPMPSDEEVSAILPIVQQRYREDYRLLSQAKQMAA